jgi:hypothetical protein
MPLITDADVSASLLIRRDFVPVQYNPGLFKKVAHFLEMVGPTSQPVVTSLTA